MKAAYQCIFLLKTYNYTDYKDVVKLFLHTAALFTKHCTKHRVILIEQSFICIQKKINGSAMQKVKKTRIIKN